jgi:succinoglycan biosynthesis transport protein ExoP
MNKAIFPNSADNGLLAAAADEFDLRQMQDFFWRHWRNIFVIASVVVTLTLLVVVTMTPLYTATAQVYLQPRKEKILGSDQIIAEMNLETGNVDSQLAVIESTNLLRRVVEKEKLFDDSEFGKDAGLWAFFSGLFRTDDDADVKNKEEISPRVLRTILNLREALGVERIKRTYVLAIAVTSKDRAKAARLANAVANAFVDDQVEARYQVAKHASVWLAERLEELRQQVRKSEEEVATFRREHGLVATSSEGNTTISEQQLSELNGKLIVARADVAEKRAKYEQAKRVIERGGDIQGIPDAVRSSAIASLREQQAEVARKEADLAARYGSRHPILVNARAERRDIDRSIAAEVQRILLNLKNDFEVAEAREKSLEVSVDDVTGKTGIDNNVGVNLRELERINAANKAIFENFLSRAKITQEQSSLEEREARVISPATKPTKPSSPKKGLALALAAVIGILMGVAGSFALDHLNPGYMTARELEEKLGYPVLASVPLLTYKDLRVESEDLDPLVYLDKKPLSHYAEAIRAIRVGIQIADIDNPPRVLLLTSSVAGEGKSTLARSLAASSVKSGQRVLLIDADLRHPSVSKFFNMENEAGLVELLAGEGSPSKVINKHFGIDVIPAGRKVQNPSDLLGSERMKALIGQFREIYDCIIVDSPPTEPVIDARLLCNLADKVVFVVRWQATPRELVQSNAESFGKNRMLAGLVLNVVDEQKIPRYGYYGQYGRHYQQKYYQS